MFGNCKFARAVTQREATKVSIARNFVEKWTKIDDKTKVFCWVDGDIMVPKNTPILSGKWKKLIDSAEYRCGFWLVSTISDGNDESVSLSAGGGMPWNPCRKK